MIFRAFNTDKREKQRDRSLESSVFFVTSQRAHCLDENALSKRMVQVDKVKDRLFYSLLETLKMSRQFGLTQTYFLTNISIFESHDKY